MVSFAGLFFDILINSKYGEWQMTNKNVQTDKKIISGKRLALTKQIQISNARLK